MNREIGKKGTGKTTRLIALAKETNSIIVTSSPEYIVNKMYRLGITGVEVVSYQEFEAKKIGFTKKYVIDELEDFVKYISGPENMIAYSLTIN